ncbi:MAG: T9SS type B sorting domain-containing protein [Bacteroidia bacterium]
MNSKFYHSNFFKAAQKALFAVLVCLPALNFAQNNFAIAAQNTKKQQMEVKKGNFTSFTNAKENREAWVKFNKNSNHPEYGKLPFNADFPGYVEVMDKRQIDERYFVNEKNPSQFYIQKGLGDLHQKINGQWITIDHRIADKGNGIYEASMQQEPVGFDMQKAVSYIKTVNGIVYFNNWKLYGETNGSEQMLASANWSNYTAGEDGIHVTNIFPGIDAEMKVLRGAIKTNFVVKQLNFTNFTNIIFKDEFISGHGSAFKFNGDAEKSTHAVGEVELWSENTSIVNVRDAVAYPLGGAKSTVMQPEYKLEGNKLGVVVPVNYIQQYIGTANIIVDPLVSSTNTLAQASITGSRYNASCNFTNFCSYNLVVNTPAMATFTDVLWTFTYQAAGICFLEDGACRFATGACLSPNTAGFYWFCNAANPGTCAGTNVSIFSDLSSCLPAPSCNAQAVTFTMQFFRDCFGNTNTTSCTSGTCIGAASPWTMVIEGHTLEFTSPGAEFTLSASTICAGQSITGTSNGISNGVPAYTENWSLNSSGTPSVGSGANASINFPTAGTYTVYYSATDACAQTVTSSQVVTVNPLPTLTVTSSPNPICTGQSSVLTASGANTYTWSAAAGGGTGATATVTPVVGTNTYSVNGTSAAGCVNSQTVSVTVNALPSVTAVASPTIVCSGSPSLLTAGGTATSFTWSANAGSVTTNTATVTPVASDTYVVTGMDANSCTNTATVTVDVAPSPTLIASATTPAICAGQTDTLNVSGATSYTWMPGGANTTTVSITPPSTTTYVVTGDNGGACTATQTVIVTVNALPSLTVTASANPVCTGSSSTLTANGATTYTWSANAGSVTTSTANITPSANDTYTVSGTQNGCTDSTTISVSITAPPTPSITATQTLICSGNPDTLTAGGATNYTWMPGGANTTTVSVSPNTTTTYTLYGANGNCLDSATFVVNVNATPTIVVNNPAPICSGSTTTLTATGATTFTWMPGSIVNDSAFVSPSITTTYVVTGDSLGCTSSQVVTVNVTTTPTVSIASTQTLICSGNPDTLTASGATNYTWMPGNVNTTTVSVSPNANTTYTLYGANGNCLDSTNFTLAVSPTPTVVASGSPTGICSGSSATLTANGATTFTWMPGSVVNDSAFVSPTSTTTYVVTGDSLGCTSTAQVVITVTATPTVLIITPTPTVCSGQSAGMIAGGAVTYTWSANAGGVTTQNAIVTPSVTTTYSVVGAVGTCTASAAQTITVTTTPTVTAVSTPTSICSGQPATITATYAPAGCTLLWAPGGATTDSIVDSPATTTVYTVTATNGACSASGNATLVVNPTPTLTISSGATQSVCNPQSVSAVSFTTTPASATYTWTNSNTAIGVAASGTTNIAGYASPNVTSVQTGTFNVSVTDPTTGCSAPAQTFTITIKPAPTITGPAKIDTAFCLTSVGAIKNLTASGGSGSLSWMWMPGGATTADSVKNLAAGSYTLVVTDSLGCSAPAQVFTVPGTNTVSASFIASTYSATAPVGVNFTNNSSGATTYTWSLGEGANSNLTNPSHTYANGGTYQVILTAGNGHCQDTAVRTIIVDQPVMVTVPNIFSPNGDGINEEFEVITSGITELSMDIFNRWGQKVFTISSVTGKWNGKLNNGHDASDGTYFYALIAKSYDGKEFKKQGSITIVR